MMKEGKLEHTKDDKNPMEKLEDALIVCKFGKFHMLLMLTTFFSVMATTSVTTATSYILPSAECDLDMSMMQKGLLNAIPFLGQFCAAFFTGFMSDAFGRKIFLFGGNFALFLSALVGAFSQSYSTLLFGKLLEGIVMSLVFTATATMVAEFTHKLIRDRVLMIYASFMSLSIVITSATAWALLPHAKRFVVIEGYFVINSWNIYLFLSACWSLLAAVLYFILPESPKFLLSHGSEKRAMLVLRKIYRINTGKSEDTFPITSLTSTPIYTTQTSVVVSFKKRLIIGLYDTKELFRAPLLCKLMLFCTTTFICLLAYSALRLWYPQLSTIVESYQKDHNGETARFCVILDAYSNHARDSRINYTMETTVPGSEICVPHLSGMDTYTNGIILGTLSLVSILVTGYMVVYFGQKLLMIVFLIACAACSGALYWTNSSIQIAILISLTCAFVQTVFSLQQSILVRVFPTTVRSMALSLVLMIGRAGSIIGNILFPIMMDMGCMVPFLTLSAVTLCTAGLVCFFPNPQKDAKTGDK